jgi:hypothetical protein
VAPKAYFRRSIREFGVKSGVSNAAASIDGPINRSTAHGAPSTDGAADASALDRAAGMDVAPDLAAGDRGVGAEFAQNAIQHANLDHTRDRAVLAVAVDRSLSKELSGAYQVASLISRSRVSRSGLRQTSPTGAQFRI